MELRVGELPRAMFPRTWKVLEEGVADGTAPGFVAGVYRLSEPGMVRVGAIGKRRLQPTEQPMLADTVFDLASVSKVLGASTLAGLLVERGWIGWDTPLQSLLPEYPRRDILLRHLLAHTAGFPAWKPFWQELRERFKPALLHSVPIEERQREMRRRVTSVMPEVAPDERALYSDVSFLLLGFALEEAVRIPLDHAIPRLLWAPMGVGGLHYRKVDRDARSGMLDEAAATEADPWRGGLLQGQVHDENCWSMGGYAGHAGVFGRAEDVLRFAAALLGGFLSRRTLAAMWTRADRPPGCERTLGWDTPSDTSSSAGRYFSAASVGHLGFTGTSLWIDPPAGIAVTLLSNRVHPTRENNRIRDLRPRFHDAIRLDLGSHPRV